MVHRHQRHFVELIQSAVDNLSDIQSALKPWLDLIGKGHVGFRIKSFLFYFFIIHLLVVLGPNTGTVLASRLCMQCPFTLGLAEDKRKQSRFQQWVLFQNTIENSGMDGTFHISGRSIGGRIKIQPTCPDAHSPTPINEFCSTLKFSKMYLCLCTNKLIFEFASREEVIWFFGPMDLIVKFQCVNISVPIRWWWCDRWWLRWWQVKSTTLT